MINGELWARIVLLRVPEGRTHGTGRDEQPAERVAQANRQLRASSRGKSKGLLTYTADGVPLCSVSPRTERSTAYACSSRIDIARDSRYLNMLCVVYCRSKNCVNI